MTDYLDDNSQIIERLQLMSETIELCKQLISVPSITPHDHNCQAILIEHLAKLDFSIDHINAGEVDNFWAQRGAAKPLLVFAGHTDVVAPGDNDAWQSDPFTAIIRDGYLYGRGAADMKSSLAAMIMATRQFIENHPQHNGSIGFLITSGEEGDHFFDGTPKVIDLLKQKKISMDYCIVGEPSSHQHVGDTIKVGRRGSLTGRLTIFGKQGHVAYPHLAENPVHRSALAINDLIRTEWDRGNEYFPPTTMQISTMHAGNGASNVIPGQLKVQFNFRYSSETTDEALKHHVEKIFKNAKLKFEIDWLLNGKPFLTKPAELIDATQQAINSVTGLHAELSTSGGTSDGRFIAPTGAQVIELGPCNNTIHQVNECVAIDDIEKLEQIYLQILENLLV